ncbi:DUF5707 domain-containing protein [Streptomyces fulvorobeus]|uniref:Calcium-binding protein n=1 Tax=Streptomyces fulvorobeus TaxID=284028 RepID=A0A7J0C9P5_9ACTN|nr:DUF5707 domain-containing protein [Streptomyces fulvorobeus]NYE42238.1 hypothetical protein [Streptomyces fulvorobeus]GFM98623.1 hypothetical protein Sfulv_34340 [Streptomyces fulvorobeus]
MRIRATVAAVSGALALSALVVPAAQADDGRTWSNDHKLSMPKAGAERFAGSSSSAAAEELPVFTKAVVNGGKPVVVGTKSKQRYSLAITATHPSGVYDIFGYVWNGASIDDPNSYGILQDEENAVCAEDNATTTTCRMTVTFDPAELYNTNAGTWKVGAAVVSRDGQIGESDYISKTYLQRFSKLTVNAGPEPVAKGKALTVTGALTRANWNTGTYLGYTQQPVKLQFRKVGTSTYTTVKTVTSSSTGSLKTSVTASADGYWRYSFAGTSTTPAVSAAGDYVDVR